MKSPLNQTVTWTQQYIMQLKNRERATGKTTKKNKLNTTQLHRLYIPMHQIHTSINSWIYIVTENQTQREREGFYCRDRWREKWRERHHQGQPTTLRNSEMLLTFTNNNSPSSNAANGICFSTKATPHPSFYYLMYPHPPNLSSFLLPNSRLQSNQNPNLVPKQSSLTFIQSNIKDKREKSGS